MRIEAMSCARSFCSSTKYGSFREEMQAFRTSVLMNSRIEAASGCCVATNSGMMERKTRRTTPQLRLSRKRIACVKKRRSGSRIIEDMRQNFRIEG